jgi:hypothetical protein
MSPKFLKFLETGSFYWQMETGSKNSLCLSIRPYKNGSALTKVFIGRRTVDAVKLPIAGERLSQSHVRRIDRFYCSRCHGYRQKFSHFGECVIILRNMRFILFVAYRPTGLRLASCKSSSKNKNCHNNFVSSIHNSTRLYCHYNSISCKHVKPVLQLP